MDGDRYRENYDAIFRKPKWTDILGAGFFADPRNPVFDGPEPVKKFARRFMKTNTEGDE